MLRGCPVEWLEFLAVTDQSRAIEHHEQRTRHELWAGPDGRKTMIPRHDSQDVPDGMLSAILRDLGLTRRDV